VDPHDPDAKLFLHYGDLNDSSQLSNLIYNVKPDEIYHLGAQSHVRVSFDMPEYTGDVTALGTTRILEAVRRSGIKTKLYIACSSEMYGDSPSPQNENSPFRPRSPYAASKLFTYWMARNYREAYKMFVSIGILFNHESPRRGETFVTRKITRAVAHILAGKQDKLYLGNLNARRDWGYAPEYVEAMWIMLQQKKPEDFVIGTGESHSVQEFVEEAFGYVDLDWKKYVEIDPRYLRPTDVESLRADITKARKKLKWKPRIKFKEIVKIMIDYDMEQLGLKPPRKGMQILKRKKLLWTNNRMALRNNLKSF
jgi:GDPmannose 4,6-dehydratase